MTILFAVSEMVPFCKTGGLADVIGALPPELAGLGHDIHVMLPGYSVIDRKRYGFTETAAGLVVPVGWEQKPLSVSSTEWKNVTVHLLENDEFFSREGLYGDVNGDYDDNGRRFIFYSRGVAEAAQRMGIKPDIVHAHDWQAGLVMTYFATIYEYAPEFYRTATLFTVHNLGYQGLFPDWVFSFTGLPHEIFHWSKLEYYGKVSFIKGGIVYAHAVSTVSETYAKEITGNELGFGLDGVFNDRRENLFGIVNGIDYNEWNPSTDRIISARYSANDLSGKTACRLDLLKTCRQNARSSVPIIGLVSRLDDQKGFDILEEAVGRLMNLDIRLVILGTGTKEHQKTMEQLSLRYPKHICVILKFDNELAHMIYAGADMFLMPSRYEPCGLGQLIAMRYGTLPVVHETGGLTDTVCDLDKYTEKGTGFSFREYSPDALVDAVMRAVKAFRAPGLEQWKGAMQRAMKKDFSWKNSALKYCDLYTHIRNPRNR